jgi:His/Glu/Gln/Arg/opine family amino acid ABC transporter permease subunit
VTSVLAYDWQWGIVWESRSAILHGVLITLEISAATMVLSLAIGGVLALAAEFAPRPLRLLAIGYVELFRAIPLLVLLFWVFLALPLLTGWTLTPFQSGLLGMTLSVSAFAAEAFRAGVTSIGRGQHEAGFSLGMTQLQMLRRVVWPQAWRATIPIVGSIWIGLFKDSALVSLIQVHDLMFESRTVATHSFRFFEVFTAVAVVYFAIAYPQARLIDFLFKRLRTVQ